MSERTATRRTFVGGVAAAVGSGGVILGRTARGWRQFVDGSPTGNGNDRYGAAGTILER
jgi:hypothetical protein